jgi:hypothetical protein
MRKFVICAVLVLATSAQAQHFDSATGAIIGGVVGNAIGKGNPTITVIGAIAGAQIANRTQHNPPPTYEVRQGPTYATVPGHTVGVPVSTPQQQLVVNCDRQYYDGEFNPPVANAYCNQLQWNFQKDQNRRMREASERADREFKYYRN